MAIIIEPSKLGIAYMRWITDFSRTSRCGLKGYLVMGTSRLGVFDCYVKKQNISLDIDILRIRKKAY